MNNRFIKELEAANKELGRDYETWGYLSYQASKEGLLSMDFIKRNIQYLYLTELLWGTKFKEDDLIYMADYIIEHPMKPTHYGQRIVEFVEGVFKHQTVSEAFIEKYMSFIDNIGIILYYQHVSEAFIERHKEEINSSDSYKYSSRNPSSNWRNICEFQDISNEYIEKLLEDPSVTDMINFDALLENPYITADRMEYIIELAEKYNRPIQWGEIGSNKNITVDFIKRHIKENMSWQEIFSTHKLPVSLIEEILDVHKDSEEYDEWFQIISYYQELSTDFMKKWWNRIAWECAVYRQKLSEDLIKMLIYKIDLNKVLKYQDLSDDMKEYITNFIKENYI